MGTYLCEYVEEEPFKEKDILLAQLKEVLHDLGECGLAQIELFKKRIVFMDQDNFSRDEKDENLIVLAYNRFEHDKPVHKITRYTVSANNQTATT